MPVIPVSEHNFSRSDRVVIDTNILVTVFAEGYEILPEDTAKWAPYTRAFEQILARKSEILLLDVILGELYKVWESKASKQWHKVGGGRGRDQGNDMANLKQFRATGPHSRFVKDFRDAVSTMLRHGSFDRVGLAATSVTDLIAELDRVRIDFNDVLIAGYCRNADCLLLTHDGDLKCFAEVADIVHG